MMPQVIMLAALIAGEAGTCDLTGQVAVAWVWHNRVAVVANPWEGWYGYAPPTTASLWIASNYTRLHDPTRGALVLLSSDDVSRAAGWLGELRGRGWRETLRVTCGTSTLHAFAPPPSRAFPAAVAE